MTLVSGAEDYDQKRDALVELFTKDPPRLPTKYVPIIPTPKQLVFLWLDKLKIEEALFGGAAGGGKSACLLMCALQYVDVPGYSALLARRTFAELHMAGGLIELSHEWLQGTDAHWSGGDERWTFPSGATLQFGHFQSKTSHYRYQGPGFQFFGADELTAFEESQWEFMTTRMRGPSARSHLGAADDGLHLSEVPIRKRATSNPGGYGHDWVKQRFVDPLTRGVNVFIPASIMDNPYIDRDAYIARLSNVRGALRDQMLHGDWDAQDDGGFFDMTKIQYVDEWERPIKTVRRWDLASTKPHTGNTDPDYTVGVKMQLGVDGAMTVTDVVSLRDGPAEVQRLMRDTAERDGKDCVQWVPIDPGQAGKDQLYNIAKSLRPFTVKGERETKAKTVRAEGAAAALESGLLRISSRVASRSSIVESQLRTFPSPGAHDDVVDALAGAFNVLNRGGRAKVSDSSPRQSRSAVTLSTVKS